MRLLGLITARSGSKRIPGKNLRLVGGKPLLAWTVLQACKSNYLTEVVVSTDGEEIASVAKSYGAKVPFLRPAEFAGDASPHLDCVLHALDSLIDLGWKPFDAVVLLQPTSPLRTVDDIDGLVKKALDEDVEAMVSVNESVEHPYLARYIDENGYMQPFIPQDVSYPRKQDLLPAYFINGAVYFNTVKSLRRDLTFYPEKLKCYEMAMDRSLQIDCEFELKLADLLLSQSGVS